MASRLDMTDFLIRIPFPCGSTNSTEMMQGLLGETQTICFIEVGKKGVHMLSTLEIIKPTFLDLRKVDVRYPRLQNR